MSLSPANTPQRPSGEERLSTQAPVALEPVRPRKLWAICFAILAFEIGGFLVLFPWMEAWRLNHFPSFYPPLFEIWDDPYLRGAISGLGIVDVIIAISQTVRLIRESRAS
jgi:hypothetical protein